MKEFQINNKINWKKYRQEFPALNTYAYLNTAGGCPLATSVKNAGVQFYNAMEQHGDIPWNKWIVQIEDTRKKVALSINADIEEVAFLSTATQATNLVSRMLPKGGVLMLHNEFPSTSLPWIHQNYPVIFVETPHDLTELFTNLKKAVRPDTRYLVTSHTHYMTGFRHDLKELSAFCKDYNLKLILDATQSFGSIPIDVKKDFIDIMWFSGYKYALAGYGVAVIYINQSLLKEMKISEVGWNSAEDHGEMGYDRIVIKKGTAALETGHPPFAGIFALNKGLDILLEISLEAIHERLTELTSYLISSLVENEMDIDFPIAEKYRSPIVMINVEDANKIKKKLIQQNIFVGKHKNQLRVSLNFYNTFKDIDRFVKAMKEFEH
ncbi:aminotransferase class V-fold PLP-dependent enzyme [Pontimicrobium sp. SW4]|uniref:Aminotransferase class V-fold PLP-dependent enzyme n=1 Tax=Pontimicrobium sp. SW4 TaxID=3153519 RepID=A0AAU7BTK7_9FLAO